MSSWGLYEGYKINMKSSDFDSLLHEITDNIPLRIETKKLNTFNKNYIKFTIAVKAMLAYSHGAIGAEIKEVSEKIIIMMASKLNKNIAEHVIDVHVKTLYDNYFSEQHQAVQPVVPSSLIINLPTLSGPAAVKHKQEIEATVAKKKAADELAACKATLKPKCPPQVVYPTPICPTHPPSYTLHDFMEKETHDPTYIIITILILLAILGGGYWWFFLRDN